MKKLALCILSICFSIQLVKDLEGNSLFDGTVKHIYTFDEGLIKTMDIERV